MEVQHSIEWFRKRLGNFTGSQVGLLMRKGRTDYFSDTAKTYIYQVASERDMNPEIVNDDVEFEKYKFWLYRRNNQFFLFSLAIRPATR